jgi:hypothetical protein
MRGGHSWIAGTLAIPIFTVMSSAASITRGISGERDRQAVSALMADGSLRAGQSVNTLNDTERCVWNERKFVTSRIGRSIGLCAMAVVSGLKSTVRASKPVTTMPDWHALIESARPIAPLRSIRAGWIFDRGMLIGIMGGIYAVQRNSATITIHAECVTGDAPLNPKIGTVAQRNDRPTQGVLVSALWNGALIRLLWIAVCAGKHRRKHGLNRSRSAGERNLVHPNAKFDPGSRNINA